jgi:hypothetical protein
MRWAVCNVGISLPFSHSPKFCGCRPPLTPADAPSRLACGTLRLGGRSRNSSTCMLCDWAASDPRLLQALSFESCAVHEITPCCFACSLQAHWPSSHHGVCAEDALLCCCDAGAVKWHAAAHSSPHRATACTGPAVQQ